jgi:WD40 repeat protein
MTVIGLLLSVALLNVGCRWEGQLPPTDPPPTVIGPRSVLLRTAETFSEMSVGVSPDGRTVAAGRIESSHGRDGETSFGAVVSLCDLASGRERATIKGPLAESCAVAFSPDGRTLAVGIGSRDFDGSYGEVRLWDVGLGGVRAILKGEAGNIRSLVFAPDGKSLITGSRRAVALWEVPPATD